MSEFKKTNSTAGGAKERGRGGGSVNREEEGARERNTTGIMFMNEFILDSLRLQSRNMN